ncbi:hypothetical protein E5161_04730 [Cohnella pontilimi]|uniref:Flagellar hook-length control protein FliK n=1 Tax=Cohnella pontilimi TaxID=2564100 RepID=A0A4U0FEF6_9BACL|nr:hypothetical protein [Cohnella pontilimi]TJY43207.1 hypothetical protein E5161_04730 [Cohnella pontilimi]
MSMNIGPMLRALMGEVQLDAAKTLELRVGQIVRGVLLEMLDNHEALMNIGGVQVRAKLEADLPVGAVTLLQVQPGSNATTISLKPLADTGDLSADEGLKEVLKSFGLPDQKWSLELARALKRDGYPIGKETADYFQTAARLKPASADLQSWMSAADVAFRRGLSATQETLASLRQALFGPPLHEQMTDLAGALKAWQNGGTGKSAGAEAAASRLQALLAQGESLLAHGEERFAVGATEPDSAGKPAGAAIQKQATRPIDVPRLTEGKQAFSSVLGPNAAVPASASALTEQIDDAGMPSGREEPRKTAMDAKTAPQAAQSVQGQLNQGEEQEPSAVGRQTAPGGRETAAPSHAAAPKSDAAWIGRFLQWLGVSHEHGLVRLASDARMPSELGMPSMEPAADDARPKSASQAADSLKSALLSLAALEDTPLSLREAAQSLVSQITGQQLLLSDRQPNAPYSLMTLFVPMKGQDGETTAAIHVQTRRGRRGEWDSDNCRLLFDLRMRNLGDTVVDVQVTDRIVSLKLMSDFPGMAELLERAKEELTSGLQSAGFQLLSVTAAALPTNKQPAEGTPAHAKSAPYSAKKYKGVDYRV